METGKVVTKRWCDAVNKKKEPIRVLVCRQRPRGVDPEEESWTIWRPELAPSKELHSAFYSKKGVEAISWEEFVTRYTEEMQAQHEEIAYLAEIVSEGKSVTLMGATACEDGNRCHRRLLKKMIEDRITAASPDAEAPAAQV